MACRISVFRSYFARCISALRSNIIRSFSYRVHALCLCSVDSAETREEKRSIMAMQAHRSSRSIMAMQARRSSMLAQARRASSHSLAVMRSNRAAKARRSYVCM